MRKFLGPEEYPTRFTTVQQKVKQNSRVCFLKKSRHEPPAGQFVTVGVIVVTGTCFSDLPCRFSS